MDFGTNLWSWRQFSPSHSLRLRGKCHKVRGHWKTIEWKNSFVIYWILGNEIMCRMKLNIFTIFFAFHVETREAQTKIRVAMGNYTEIIQKLSRKKYQTFDKINTVNWFTDIFTSTWKVFASKSQIFKCNYNFKQMHSILRESFIWVRFEAEENE